VRYEDPDSVVRHMSLYFGCHSGLLARRPSGGSGIFPRIKKDSRQAGVTEIRVTV